MSESEVREALESLVAKGLAKKRVVNGKPEYCITETGLRVLEHLKDM